MANYLLFAASGKQGRQVQVWAGKSRNCLIRSGVLVLTVCSALWKWHVLNMFLSHLQPAVILVCCNTDYFEMLIHIKWVANDGSVCCMSQWHTDQQPWCQPEPGCGCGQAGSPGCAAAECSLGCWTAPSVLQGLYSAESSSLQNPVVSMEQGGAENVWLPASDHRMDNKSVGGKGDRVMLLDLAPVH